MDLHALFERLLDDLRSIWTTRFEMMQEIGKSKVKMGVATDDEVKLDMANVQAADASKDIACVAIYGRYLKKGWDIFMSITLFMIRISTQKSIPTTKKKSINQEQNY